MSRQWPKTVNKFTIWAKKMVEEAQVNDTGNIHNSTSARGSSSGRISSKKRRTRPWPGRRRRRSSSKRMRAKKEG